MTTLIFLNTYQVSSSYDFSSEIEHALNDTFYPLIFKILLPLVLLFTLFYLAAALIKIAIRNSHKAKLDSKATKKVVIEIEEGLWTKIKDDAQRANRTADSQLNYCLQQYYSLKEMIHKK